MALVDTLTKLNLEGANVKELKRLNNKLVVVKDIIQQNCFDNIAEAMIYDLAVLLEVNCSPAGLLFDRV